MRDKAEHKEDLGGGNYNGSSQDKNGRNGDATTLIAIGIIIAIAAIIVIFSIL